MTSTRRCRFSCRFPSPLTGTLGAFIRIREPIPQKRMLFDIGIAGPIAGFVIAVPALFMGVWMSHLVRIPPDFTRPRARRAAAVPASRRG